MTGREIIDKFENLSERFKQEREQKLSTESLEEIRAWCSKREAEKPWYGEFGDSPKMLMKCDFMVALIDEVLASRRALSGDGQ